MGSIERVLQTSASPNFRPDGLGSPRDDLFKLKGNCCGGHSTGHGANTGYALLLLLLPDSSELCKSEVSWGRSGIRV